MDDNVTDRPAAQQTSGHYMPFYISCVHGWLKHSFGNGQTGGQVRSAQPLGGTGGGTGAGLCLMLHDSASPI